MLGAKRTSAAACAGALALGCGSHPDLGSDPQWGVGFSTRLTDAGNVDAPSSVGQACAQFGGAPYDYPSIDDLQAKLSRRWVGCDDNPVDLDNFWPSGFVGVQLDPAGTWQALVSEADGSVQPATAGNADGTYVLVRYADDSAQYAQMFELYFLPSGSPFPGDPVHAAVQWQGWLEQSPDVLEVVSAHTASQYRFSSASP
jgi:hypothetical protein